MKKLNYVIWALVFIIGGLTLIQALRPKPNQSSAQQDGRVFVDIRWEHLPDIAPFEFTERSGETFDSTDLAGKAYVVNFFFTSCPTICRDFNRKVKYLAEKFEEEEDLVFLSITVDPETDTPSVLKRYAESPDFEAGDNWKFLTGALFEINELGEQSFRVVADTEHHTDDIMLVDRWGRYRDRFKWYDDREMKRFETVVNNVLDENEPPIGTEISTRNVLASEAAYNPKMIPYLRDFRLESSRGGELFSRDLTGQVWLASVFYTRCPTICKKQNRVLSGMQERLKQEGISLVSITSDPAYDRPDRLRVYSKEYDVDPEVWTMLTGEKKYVDRVLSEYLKVHAHGGHHSTELILMDRWGNRRGTYDWQDEQSIQQMFAKAKSLANESSPVQYWNELKAEKQKRRSETAEKDDES